MDKKFGQSPLPPHLDKIQKNSSFFRETVPNFSPHLGFFPKQKLVFLTSSLTLRKISFTKRLKNMHFCAIIV